VIEENALDQVLRAYVKKELVEKTLTDEERDIVLTVFSRTTFDKEITAEPLKSIDRWISIHFYFCISRMQSNFEKRISNVHPAHSHDLDKLFLDSK
jgi:hypothetical protein